MQFVKQARAVNFLESTTKYTPERLIICGSSKKIRKAGCKAIKILESAQKWALKLTDNVE